MDKILNTDINEDLTSLIIELMNERGTQLNYILPKDESERIIEFRKLLNLRDPLPINNSFRRKQNKVLKTLIKRKGIVTLNDLPLNTNYKNIRIWAGDITRLKIDAIINAANKQMLGCFIPNHNCVDNEIHTFS